MVWSYAISDLALSTDVSTSVQTSVSASVQYTPAGALHDDYINRSIGFDDHMATSKISISQSTISTCTSFVTTTNTCLSTSIQISHSTMFTYDSMCSNSIASPSTPSIPSSQPRHSGTPFSKSPGGQTTTDESRTYGFDLNPHWQEDQDHYDNQKINGLTFPRCIRPSAFTQKLDIEECDPFEATGSGLTISAGQQLLASEAGSWA